MKNAAIVIMLFALCACAYASPIIHGNGPSGMLTNATLDISNGSAAVSDHYDQFFTVLVSSNSNSTGTGALVFDGYLGATSYTGPGYVQSYSQIYSPFTLSTQAYLPQGSTGVTCGYSCIVSFTFNVPMQMHFVADSYAAYQGNTAAASGIVRSYVMMYGLTRVYSYDLHSDILDADVSFGITAHNPEPATWILLSIGLVAMILIGWRNRV